MNEEEVFIYWKEKFFAKKNCKKPLNGHFDYGSILIKFAYSLSPNLTSNSMALIVITIQCVPGQHGSGTACAMPLCWAWPGMWQAGHSSACGRSGMTAGHPAHLPLLLVSLLQQKHLLWYFLFLNIDFQFLWFCLFLLSSNY